MDYKNLPADLRSKLQQLQKEIKNNLPRIVAVEAREHFVDNFRKGGFVNNGLHKWQEVKRRDPNSKWYGFEYHGDTRANMGKKGRLNYSPTATQRDVLTSKRNYLMSSLKAEPQQGKAVISTDAPHAEIHNEGGTFKVFGKHSATMPKRQFVGPSKELDDKVEKMIIDTIDKIFNK